MRVKRNEVGHLEQGDAAGAGVAASTSGTVRTDRPDDGVLRIIFDHESARNAITMAMLREFDTVLDRAESDTTVRAVVITGAGEKAFSSGYDLNELGALDPVGLDSAVAEQSAVLWRYLTFPKPTVAAMVGASRGAGTLFAACSDLRIGDEGTDIAVSAVNYDGANLTWLLDQLIGAGPARDLLMTGRSVDGREALRIGLLSRLAPVGAVHDAALGVARELAGKSPRALREMKKLVLGHAGHDLAHRFDRESHVARTTLRPLDLEGEFAGVLSGRAPAAGNAETGSRGADHWVPSWEDPFVPTVEADDDFVSMMDALSELQEAATRSLPTPTEAANFTDRLRELASELRRHEVSEDEQQAGKRWDVAGRAQTLMPPLHLVETTPTTVRGHVTIGRFHSGRHAMNGGVTPLIFDELLSRLANSDGRTWARTAFLKVDYRAPAPLDRRLSVSAVVSAVEGRKRFVRGTMHDGDTLVAEAEGLWVEVRGTGVAGEGVDDRGGGQS